jgi:hypothetical protein
MNNLRRFCTMLILTMALASAVHAEGPVNCPGVTQTPPQPTAAGEIQYDITDTLLLIVLALV